MRAGSAQRQNRSAVMKLQQKKGDDHGAKDHPHHGMQSESVPGYDNVSI